MRVIVCLALLALLGGCAHHPGTEKYQSERNDVIDVKEKLKELDTGDVLIGSVSSLCLSDEYLMIVDYKSVDKLIQVFNKNDFSYVTAFGDFGQGPEEIAVIGPPAVDVVHHKLYVPDYGKLKLFSYDMDSILIDPFYKPRVKLTMNQTLFPSDYRYINDTLSIAVLIKPTSSSTFDQFLGRWNMSTGEIIPMKYTFPDIKKKRITFDISREKGIYAECYTRHDLMTICSLDGELQYNIYGPDWDCGDTRRLHCFGKVMIGNDKIFVGYCGKEYDRESLPTKILVFDLEGNYFKTLDIGYRILDSCYDSSNNRIIMSLNDNIQFAYLDLDGIL